MYNFFKNHSVPTQENLIKVNGLHLCCQTFGNSSSPAILLIQGSNAQGLLWPDTFCELLAQNEYFVVRYDHRDTGMSDIIDFDVNPYSLIDLTNDAKGILDELNIRKAHIVGSSMGGYIAQLLGVYYPELPLTLTFMMTSPISASLEHAFLEESENPFPLPLPTKKFADTLLEGTLLAKKSEESITNSLLSTWSAYNGESTPFDKNHWYSLALLWHKRSKLGLHNINHRCAINSSPLTREKELQCIKAPTLIIHGETDPFFTLEHAYALKKSVPHASLKIIKKMGHLFHEAFIEEVLQKILIHFKVSNSMTH